MWCARLKNRRRLKPAPYSRAARYKLVKRSLMRKSGDRVELTRSSAASYLGAARDDRRKS
jgi:hypothetical protein